MIPVVPAADEHADSSFAGLNIRPGCRVWVGGHNPGAKRLVMGLLAEARRPPDGPLDLGFVAPRNVDEGVYFARKILPRIVASGAVWIVCPEPVSPRSSEFSGTHRRLGERLFDIGLVETKAVRHEEQYTFHRFERAAR